jgi:hypothetical protein
VCGFGTLQRNRKWSFGGIQKCIFVGKSRNLSARIVEKGCNETVSKKTLFVAGFLNLSNEYYKLYAFFGSTPMRPLLSAMELGLLMTSIFNYACYDKEYNHRPGRVPLF